LVVVDHPAIRITEAMMNPKSLTKTAAVWDDRARKVNFRYHVRAAIRLWLLLETALEKNVQGKSAE